MRGPIVYDETAAPTAVQIKSWVAALDLPARDWQVIRLLLGRIVLLGYDKTGVPDWVLKAGSGERPHEASFERAAANARILRTLAQVSGARWLVTADPDAYRKGRAGDFALLAQPHLPGRPLAPEHRLSIGEMTTLGYDTPTLLKVMGWLESLTSADAGIVSNTFVRAPYVAHMIARLAERLVALVSDDGLAPQEADQINAEFARRINAAPLRPVFGHGELTPWHVLRRPDGKLSLIDLETMGIDVAGADLSVLVMRTWALNAAPTVAEHFLRAYRERLSGVAHDELEAELAWQWLYAAVRTRKESLTWRERGEALSFWDWATRDLGLAAATVTEAENESS